MIDGSHHSRAKILRLSVATAIAGVLASTKNAKADNSGSVSQAGITTPITATGATTARTLPNYFGDALNVKDFGATLNGTTDDTAAIIAAYAALPSQGGVLLFPQGGQLNVTSNPTATGENVWKLNGLVYAGTSTPVNGGNTGADMFDTIYGGGYFWGRGSPNSTNTPILRIDDVKNGGTVGDTYATLLLNTTVNSGMTGSFWPLTVNLTGTAVAGQHVGINSTVSRGASTVTGGGACEYWSFSGQIADMTGQASSVAGPLVGYEQDIAGTGLDDGGAQNAAIPAGAGIRTGMDVLGTGVASSSGEIGWMVRAGASGPSSSGTNWDQSVWSKRVFSAIGVYAIACLDTSMAQSKSGSLYGTPVAILMAANQQIGFDGSSPTRLLFYNSGTNQLEYSKSGSSLFTVGDSGIVGARGYTAALSTGTTGVGLSGSGATGVDTSGATLTGPAVRVASLQKISLEGTDTAQMFWNSGAGTFNLTFSGTNFLTLTGNSALTLKSSGSLIIGSDQVVGARQTGWTAPTGTVSRATFAVSTVTLPSLAAAVAALIDDLTTHGLIGP